MGCGEEEVVGDLEGVLGRAGGQGCRRGWEGMRDDVGLGQVVVWDDGETTIEGVSDWVLVLGGLKMSAHLGASLPWNGGKERVQDLVHRAGGRGVAGWWGGGIMGWRWITIAVSDQADAADGGA